MGINKIKRKNMSEIILNVYGEELRSCSANPLTGYFRDGLCNTCFEDTGMHTVCMVATEEFLNFSKARGNDLSTPMPQYNFPGLKPGDKWCLCAGRWVEAYQAGVAPKLYLEATHEETLAVVSLEVLEKFKV